MLLSMAASNNVSPDNIAGVAIVAGSVATGLGAAATSRRALLRQRRAMLMELSRATVTAEKENEDPYTERSSNTRQILFELELRRITSLFRRSDVSFYISISLIAVAAALFIWGGVLVILGVTAAHIISVISSAIPAAISVLSKRTSDNAEKQADRVFDRLVEKIDRMDAESREDSGKTRLERQKASRLRGPLRETPKELK